MMVLPLVAAYGETGMEGVPGRSWFLFHSRYARGVTQALWLFVFSRPSVQYMDVAGARLPEGEGGIAGPACLVRVDAEDMALAYVLLKT